MAVPKQRKTKSRRNNRRMHLFIKEPSLAVCPKCGKGVLPHTLCLHCGHYKGVEKIDVLKELTKKERKKREKEMAQKEKQEQKARPLSMEELSKK